MGRKIKVKNFLFGFILLLAAFFRFYHLDDYLEFLGDQGRDLIIVRRFLVQGDLMFIGPQTSVGNMYLGPWYYYLIAPALRLANFSPLGPAILIVFLSLFAVWLIWRVGQSWFGEKTALLATLLMAFSPAVIYYSIFSWNPNIMPLLALLSGWFLWQIWQEQQYQKIPLLAFSLALVLNSHYLGLLLFPLAGVFWFLSLKKIWQSREKRKFFHFSLLALFLFLFLMSPLVLFDWKHNFINFNAFKQFFTVRQTTVNLKFYKGLVKLPLVFNQLYAQLLLRRDFWFPAYFVFPLLLLTGWRARKNKAVWLLFLWLLIGLLGLANYKQHLYAHYYGFLWPAALLLLALALSSLNLMTWPLLAYFLYLMITNWHGWQRPNYQLKRAQLIARVICQKAQEKNLNHYNIVNLASYNDFRALAYRYFLLKDCSLIPQSEDQYPQSKNLFIIWEDPSKYPQPLEVDVWEIQSNAPWQIEESFSVFDTQVLYLRKSD